MVIYMILILGGYLFTFVGNELLFLTCSLSLWISCWTTFSIGIIALPAMGLYGGLETAKSNA